MLRKEKLHLLPALMVTAENDASPVTYLVLSLRLCGLGGDRACRAMLKELQREMLVQVERQTARGDLREKVVSVTEKGWGVLRQHAETVTNVLERSPQSYSRIRETARKEEAKSYNHNSLKGP